MSQERADRGGMHFLFSTVFSILVGAPVRHRPTQAVQSLF